MKRLDVNACKISVLICMVASSEILCIENQIKTPVQTLEDQKNMAPVPSAKAKPEPAMPFDKNLTTSAIVTKAWLETVDKGQYGESWEEASQLMKNAIEKPEWIKILEKVRQPLGEVKSRSVLDQRTAKNPKNMPAGDYMVLFYNTSFAKKPSAYELVTLYLEPDGQWRVITYTVN
jgi:hypothetical protein